MPFAIPTSWNPIGAPHRVVSGEVVRAAQALALVENDRRVRATRLRCLFADHDAEMTGSTAYYATSLVAWIVLFDAVPIRVSDEAPARLAVNSAGVNVRVRVTVTLPGGGFVAATIAHAGAAETLASTPIVGAPLAAGTTFFLTVELLRDAAVAADGTLTGLEVVESDLTPGDL